MSTAYSTQWQAGELLSGLVELTPELSALSITNISLDSRTIQPGGLFLALAGRGRHGLEFLSAAVAHGAVLVLAEGPVSRDMQSQVPVLVIDALSSQVAQLAAKFYRHPADLLRIIGVTGTNGKTSTTHFLAQALRSAWRCGVIGTLGNGFVGELQAATHTTPDAVSVQCLLADMRSQGAQAVAMEVSSHALDQGRLDQVPVHTALFTNLTRDHLDYHQTMARYGEAKLRLFSRPDLKFAVINAGDELAQSIPALLPSGCRLVRCYFSPDAKPEGEFLQLQALSTEATGLVIRFVSSWGEAELRTRLFGHFNAHNLLLTAGVLLAWGMPMAQIVPALSAVRPVPGRMQVQGGTNGQPLVVVDYAHTPDALEQALRALRPHTQGKLICVFGCGGDRDAGKRPLMGRLAEQLADVVMITDDNPRHEVSAEIIQQIQSGMQCADQALVVADRAQAIRQAIALAQASDVVLVAGKGHEQTQQVGDDKFPFDDVTEVASALQELAHA